MNVRALSPQSARAGSVLIIVLWVALGLITLGLYFAQSMSFELKAADNAVASVEAQQAIQGAARYIAGVLTNDLTEPGRLPYLQTYGSEAVPVGESYFWIIGRPSDDFYTPEPVFGLVDEGSKLNLNTATAEMLELLPGMTPELAAAIVDWRDENKEPGASGAEEETYLRRRPAYRAKDGKFETVDELRLVLGAELDVLYGEDQNLNGAIEANENDADGSSPADDGDGRLLPGILEYVTVYTREGMLRPDGSPKINVAGGNAQELRELLEEKFGAARAAEIAGRLGGPGQPPRTLLDFYLRSGMTAEEFAQVEAELSVSNQPREGLVNVNTASEAVLACIPGIGVDKAAELVAYRQTNSDKLLSLAWILEVLDRNNALQAAAFLTTLSHQFTADIAAVGRHGRGYQRVRFLFDTSEGAPQIRYRQDLTHLGWALGQTTRELLLEQKEAMAW